MGQRKTLSKNRPSDKRIAPRSPICANQIHLGMGSIRLRKRRFSSVATDLATESRWANSHKSQRRFHLCFPNGERCRGSLEKFFCRPKSAFVDRGASQLQRGPRRLALPKVRKIRKATISKQPLASGEFLCVERDFSQFIQTPGFAHSCIHLLERRVEHSSNSISRLGVLAMSRMRSRPA